MTGGTYKGCKHNYDQENPESPRYADRVTRELDSYKEVRPELALPPIFTYWAVKHLSPRMEAVMGTAVVEEFYAIHLAERLQRANATGRIASLGSGDCATEIEVAKRILAKGVRNITFECFDLSPYVLVRAKQAIDAAGLGEVVRLREADANVIHLETSAYDGIMVSHALHHFVELEHIFGTIAQGLIPTGVFVCSDMIGRNGHMRWPEAEQVVRQLWRLLPAEYRYNYLARRQEDEFVNWDCSSDSFEGIRAQDILPLLVERFHFEKFVGFGNLPDVFIERTIGPHFSVDNPHDTALIDFLEDLNSILINAGLLKPTQMFAVMSKGGGEVKCDRGWTPDFCVRDPHIETLLPHAPALSRSIPVEKQSSAG
jgi:SAM-dependent methyltransferase